MSTAPTQEAKQPTCETNGHIYGNRDTCLFCKKDKPAYKPPVNEAECVRLCEAMAAFWSDCCDAAIYPGAYITEEDVPFRDLVRAAVGWRKP